MLRYQVIALRSGIQVESTGGWLGGANRDPEGPSSRPGGSGRQPGGVKSSGSWHKKS